MARYIDADKFKDFVDMMYPVAKQIKEYFKKQIDMQPTADVVEVIRCKDCKFRGHIQLCPFGKRNMPLANGYCCYGERREDEQIH